MPVLAGPLAAAAVLLALGALPKLALPAATSAALRALGLPAAAPLVRALGGVELAVAAAVLAVGGPGPAAALGVLYAGFSGFVVLALVRRPESASCGCFGRSDTPPTRAHAVLTAAAAAVGGAAAVTTPVPGVLPLVADAGWLAAPLLLLVATVAGLGRLVVDALPALRPDRRTS